VPGSPTANAGLDADRASATLSPYGQCRRGFFQDGDPISISYNQNFSAPMVPQRAFSFLLRPDAIPVSSNASAIFHEVQIARLRNIDTPDNPMHRGE